MRAHGIRAHDARPGVRRLRHPGDRVRRAETDVGLEHGPRRARAHSRRGAARHVRRRARARDRGRPLRPASCAAREHGVDGGVLAAGRHRGRARAARDLQVPHRAGARWRTAKRHRADGGVCAARDAHRHRRDHRGRGTDRRNDRRGDRGPARAGARLAVHLRAGRSAAGPAAARDGMAAAGIAPIPRAPPATCEGARHDPEPGVGGGTLRRLGAIHEPRPGGRWRARRATCAVQRGTPPRDTRHLADLLHERIHRVLLLQLDTDGAVGGRTVARDGTARSAALQPGRRDRCVAGRLVDGARGFASGVCLPLPAPPRSARSPSAGSRPLRRTTAP